MVSLVSFCAPNAFGDGAHAERLKTVETFVTRHCLDCHSTDDPSGKLDLETFDFQSEQFLQPDFQTDRWERILRRLETRQMPPSGVDRPGEEAYEAVSRSITKVLDDRAKRFPRYGRIGSLRRMTRTEYQNAIRDLLGVRIDAANYLPKDQESHGFDNITVEGLSPTHLNRYLTAARKISRAAIGGIGRGPVGVTLRIPADRSQENHVAGLPFGTRGGLLIRQHFPQAGDYEIEIKLTRDRDEKVEGLHQPHDIHILLDRERMHEFTVKPPGGTGGWQNRDYTHTDSHLRTRIPIPAGEHQVGITFPKIASSLTESQRQPFDTNFNRHRHPRKTPAIYQVSIVGPFAPQGPGHTRSRQLLFGSDTPIENPTRADAQRMLTSLARRAYRRVPTSADVAPLMRFYDEAANERGFEAGMESAVAAVLVNPNFLFRIESATPPDGSTARFFAIGDFELASRLSFFLWSSLPDEELLDLAEAGTLSDPEVLTAQVRRMLDDERSSALVDNFAAQWLQLRNLDAITPDLRLFPDFDDNLRQAFQQETKLLFREVLQSDRSILDLIRSDHTWLNERLAVHYGIPLVRGSHFRPVAVSPDSHRGGILRHGSVLMVTSYATRTSPTIRGNWILENIFGTPAPPPPPDVPNLQEKTTLKASTVRERLAVHRANPSCAVCHDLIDPLGFALENFDAVGRWREFEETLTVDATGTLPDGTRIRSVDDLERGILGRPELFARTVTEKLMTFGLGRAVGPDDGPIVRRIVEHSAEDNFTLRSLITGIVLSEPFRMRTRETP